VCTEPTCAPLLFPGDNFGIPLLNMFYLAKLERSFPSTAFLMPFSQFWTSNDVIATRPGRNYTTADYQALYSDMRFAAGWEMYKDTSGLFDPHWVPDVGELYCAYGTDIKTPEVLRWKNDKDFPSVMPEIHHGNGDGTVNIRSLSGCLRWPLKEHLAYSGATHMSVLKDARLIADVKRILRN